ncbi:MAG: WG repeat-containing protein [Bacteroidetes bacterium]|nr:WG repeat-containing protein [Bacteroidota bacterium]
MNVKSKIVLLFFISLASLLQAGKLEKGFEALSMHDYFKAKKIFLQLNAKKTPNPYSQYGLATIFIRNNNPFYNLDSARKYAYLSHKSYNTKPLPKNLSGFLINHTSIAALIDSVTQAQFRRAKNENSLAVYNTFLKENTLASEDMLNRAIYLRDKLEFNKIKQINHSDSTHQFLKMYPQSVFYKEADLLKQHQIYNETTASGTALSFIQFLDNNPDNVMRNTAYEKLFDIYRQKNNKAGLANFVKNYPEAPQNLEAWNLLFALTVKSFSYSELKKFVEKYPDFPLKNSVLKELELNKIVLLPYQKNDYTGFIDTAGKFVIAPVYDAAGDFFEGLSVVNKNDTVFFIDKENANAFNTFYDDALMFKNGIAPVKQNNKWFFINRRGQTISGLYDEINELSSSVYVVKLNNRYGALDRFGQVIISPKFEKLGDFKNGYAYYVENGNYGFVSVADVAYQAEFEWISDFNEEQIAVFRQNNKYGLISAWGIKILEPEYEQIIEAKAAVYIVVQNGNYGFFNSQESCFFTPVAYEYAREKPTDYYTNGKLFKLLKQGKQAFVNPNGHIEINFGTYDEINFASENLIRVKKNGKYGFLDRKLTVAIPYKYQLAQDFKDSLAIVSFNGKNVLINTSGKEIYASEEDIEKLSAHHYTVGNEDKKQIVDNTGLELYINVKDIQKINPHLFILTLENGDIKLLRD